jgi:hypothetical protein
MELRETTLNFPVARGSGPGSASFTHRYRLADNEFRFESFRGAFPEARLLQSLVEVLCRPPLRCRHV